MAFTVFISFKNLDDNGNPTPESRVAEELYRRLRALGVEVFFSNVEVQRQKRVEYEELIDEALESSVVMLLICSDAKNLQGEWMKYERDVFSEEIRSGRKKNGKIITVIDKNMKVGDLPIGLRRGQKYTFDQLDLVVDMVLGQQGVEVNKAAAEEIVFDESLTFVSYKIREDKIVPDESHADEQEEFVFQKCAGGYAVTGYKGKGGIVMVPAEYNGEPVVRIFWQAFMNCTDMISVKIPNSVNIIDSYCFRGCSGLTSVAIPDSVESIGSCAFEYCTSLEEITVPDSVKTLGGWIFDSCTGLASVKLPAEITDFTGLFENCTSLKHLNIPDHVTCIGDNAFKGCTGLESVRIPESVTCIGKDAFRGCERLTGISVPESAAIIGNRAFMGCKGLKNITVPGSVRMIGAGAFNGCTELSSVKIEKGLEDIGEGAFVGCVNLGSITLPDSVKTIGRLAFSGCRRLKKIAIPKSVTSIGEKAFMGCEEGLPVDMGIWDATRKKFSVFIHAPHEPDYYGYTPDSGVTWVLE